MFQRLVVPYLQFLALRLANLPAWKMLADALPWFHRASGFLDREMAQFVGVEAELRLPRRSEAHERGDFKLMNSTVRYRCGDLVPSSGIFPSCGTRGS